MMALLLNANDSVSRSYSITKPSPLHPIMPSGCGERTENLFDVSKIAQGSWGYNSQYDIIDNYVSNRVKVPVMIQINPEKTYTISVFPKTLQLAIYIADENNKYKKTFGWSNINSLTISDSYGAYIAIKKHDNSLILPSDVDGVTVVEGSTAPESYEPYGYKLPILSNSTVTNIYLGEAETTRRIKKLVLTGEETLRYESVYTRFVLDLPNGKYMGVRKTPTICTHYTSIDDGRSITEVPNNAIYIAGSATSTQLYIKTDTYASIDAFKSYLAAQYAAGTPVTVWYVLAEPEKAVVNEPLMKIGDYADTIDSTQTSVQIPTFAGTTVIDWAGEGLAPSEVELTYRKQKGQ